jgi:nicotinamidase-related amidase
MQCGSFTEATPRFDAEGVVQRINALSAAFRQTGKPVIFVQHDGTSEGCFIPGTQDWSLLPELTTASSDILISKTANDSFYETDLAAVLQRESVNHLIVTGCATDFCVESTIQSALVKNYNITVISNGHTSADRPHAKAKTIIDHYNWVWENMTPTKGRIEVVAFENFISEL